MRIKGGGVIDRGELNEFIRNELHRIMVTAQRQGPSDYDHIYATARHILREIAGEHPVNQQSSSPSVDAQQDDAGHDLVYLAQYLARGHNGTLVRFTTGRVHIVANPWCLDGPFETLCRSVTLTPQMFRGSDPMCWRCLREARS